MPQQVLDAYPMFADFLRLDAVKVFLWISDDDPDTHTADAFRAALDGLSPSGMFARTIHNAIVGYYGDGSPADWSNPAAGTCDGLARVGEMYLRLVDCLDDVGGPVAGCEVGRRARVCETNWTPIFDTIATGVAEGVPIACDLSIPELPGGVTVGASDIDVTYTRGDGGAEPLLQVGRPAECVESGYFLDDLAAPTRITLCPALCERVRADPSARVDVGTGC
jgi:hypothetical protein